MQSEIKQLYVSLDDKLLEKLQQSFRLWAVVVCVSLRCVCVSVRCAVCCRKHFHSFNQQSDSRQMMQQLLTSNHIYTQTHNQLTFDSVPRWHTSRVTLTLLSLSALCDVLQPTESDSSSAFIHLTPNLLLLADWAAILCLRQSELFLDTFSQESLCLYSHRSH